MSLFFSTGSFIARSPAGAADDYATLVTGLGGLVAHWRLGDAGAGTLADASGNGHHGSYGGSPTFQAADLTRFWQGSDGRAVDFAGSGHGVVPHHPAFALPQGSLSFWFQVDDLASEQGLLGKDQSGTTDPDDQMAVRVKVDGTLNAYFQRGGGGIDLETIPGVVTAGEAHHAVVTWSEKITRLWLDGRQVAKNEGHDSGIVGNDLPWRFGIRTFDDALAAVRLDEVALFDRALLFDDVQALSQHLAGMGYRDADALRVVNVGSAGALNAALADARPGDHIVLATGTYVGPFDATADGTRADPIVVRAAAGAAVTIAGDFELHGARTILAGVAFTDGGGAEIFGHHCRITRCANQGFTGGFGAIVRAGASFARIDHCRLGPPAADSGGSSFTNQPLRFRVEGTAPTQKPMYGLADHLDLLGAPSELGNGRDVVAIGNEVAFGVGTYTTLHRSILDQSPKDEGISLKGTHAIVQHCTFKALIYTQNRWGEACEWRSNYYEGCEHNDFGRGHWHIGNSYDGNGNDLRLGSGSATSDAFIGGGGGPGRPASESPRIIGNSFLNGAIIEAGQPDWDTGVDGSGAMAEANSGFEVIYYPTYSGTFANAPTTTEPYLEAVPLAAAEVGPDALDPLVPPGWK